MQKRFTVSALNDLFYKTNISLLKGIVFQFSGLLLDYWITGYQIVAFIYPISSILLQLCFNIALTMLQLTLPSPLPLLLPFYDYSTILLHYTLLRYYSLYYATTLYTTLLPATTRYYPLLPATTRYYTL